MLKKGDSVIYIEKDNIFSDLIYLKKYLIQDIKYDTNIGQHNKPSIILVTESDYYESAKNFISLKDYRKQKLQKLCSKLVI